MKRMPKETPLRNTKTIVSIGLLFTCWTLLDEQVIAIDGPGRAMEIQFTYQVTVQNIPEDAEQLTVWIPAPQGDENQSIFDLKLESPYTFSPTRDPEYGNLVYRLNLTDPLPRELSATMTFRAFRQEASPASELPSPGEPDPLLKRFLAPDSLVPIDGPIAEEAHQVVRGLTGDREKARALYDHIVATMRYDKSGTGWGNGDAVFASNERRGNCTDVHSLLIGMARAEEIPARFVMGFPLPQGEDSGAVGGYHCWAELFIEDQGWVPVDASEAIKHSEQSDYYFGALDPYRVAFTLGRDIPLEGSSGTIRANYLIYPLVEIDGSIYSDIAQDFHFRLLQPGE